VLRGAWPPERVVIGDDGSEAAKQAGKLAAGIGRLFDARGALVRAYPEMPELGAEGRVSNPRLVDDALRRAEVALVAWHLHAAFCATLANFPAPRAAPPSKIPAGSTQVGHTKSKGVQQR
jgi:hypothetical protein